MRHTVINTDIHNSINTVIYIFYTVITCVHICIICTFIYIYIYVTYTLCSHILLSLNCSCIMSSFEVILEKLL